MVDIYNINSGWLTIKINDREFVASYLTNVVEDIDEKINYLSENLFYYHNPELIYFDGEGKDLYLTLKTNGEKLILIWEQYDKENLLEAMTFNFNEFVDEWKELKTRIKDDYNENFIMDLYKKME
jgi:hypothetical protein